MRKIKFLKFVKIIRWNDYGPEKLPHLLCIAFYIAIAKGIYNSEFIGDTLIFAVFAIVSSIYGYLINDLGDIDIDRKHGKTNAFHSTTYSTAVLIMVGILFIDSVLAFSFLDRPFFLWLWILWILLSTFYSLPPFRFKERGPMGIVIPALAQQTLPVLIVFSIYDYFKWIEILILLLFPTTKGFSLILRHQFYDFEKDFKTNTRTLAVNRGKQRLSVLFSWTLRLELVAIWITLSLILWKFSGLTETYFVKWLNPAYALIFIFACFFAGGIKYYFRHIIPDPYSQGGVLGFLHITFPTFVLPTYLLSILFFSYPPYGILLIFLLVLSYRYTFQIKDRWMTGQFLHSFRKIVKY